MASDGPLAVAIPDPGVGEDQWFADENFHSTPQTAWPVGTATMPATYVEGMGDESGVFFFVFRAGGTSATFSLQNVFDFTEFHLHDGSDGVFGDLIEPTEEADDGATWPVELGEVYVLELAGGPAGFF